MTSAGGRGAGPAIVVGVDESERAQDALALGETLARLCGGNVVAAAVYRRERSLLPGSDAADDELRVAAEQSLEGAVATRDVPIETRAVAAASPARGLHELAEATGAQFIVVGSTRRGGVGRVLPGSTGERLLQESPCAVAVAPLGHAARAGEAVRVVATGYDLTPESEAALELAAELAGAAEATIRILTVDEPRSARSADAFLGAAAARPFEDARQRLRATVMDKRDALPAALRADAQVLSGFPARELLEELDKGVDLMVIGSRGYGPVGRALAGSVSVDVIRQAPCPVVLVPRVATRHSAPPGGARAQAATENSV